MAGINKLPEPTKHEFIHVFLALKLSSVSFKVETRKFNMKQ